MMRKRRYGIRQVLTVFLAAALFIGGCGEGETLTSAEPVKAGQTISDDSKWINSDIDGAVMEDTEVSLKDDFYTAVNKEWILEQKPDKKHPVLTSFRDTADIVDGRKLALIQKSRGEREDGCDNSVGLEPELLAHDWELIESFASLAGDWEKRNELGIEPARPYIEAIRGIGTMDELTAYLLNEDGMNITRESLVNITVAQALNREETYCVMIEPVSGSKLSLGSQDEYRTYEETMGVPNKRKTDQRVHYLLERMGYEEQETDRILKLSYRFEARLAERMKDVGAQSDIVKYLEEADNHYGYEELLLLGEGYPLKEELERRGLDGLEDYTVTEPDYVKAVRKLYNVKYLEEIKAYYTVHTVQKLIPLLDRESFEQLRIEPEDEEEEEDGVLSEEEEILINYYFAEYLPGVLDQVYVAEYCTKEQKEWILDLIAQSVSYYRQMLKGEEWLSEDAKEKLVEKLDSMTVRAVYPDRFKDYRELRFESYEDEGAQTGATLVDAVNTIYGFQERMNGNLIRQSYDKSWWDLDTMETTTVNAAYMGTENSINILAGYLSSSFVYDPDAGVEQNFARLGTTIGHELTHAFDAGGMRFDKNGTAREWIDKKDKEGFQRRNKALVNYYNGIIPYPGAENYDGSLVAGEATADMGGVKCMLGLAEQIEDFDYDCFFRAYAELWRSQCTYEAEQKMLQDEHPLAFLRTNATLQQFEKFYETYDIGPEDGMYLAPEKRIPVW